MAQKVPSKAAKELLKIIETNPDGFSVAYIEKALIEQLPRRAFQHQVQQMIKQAQLRNTGQRRQVKYFPMNSEPEHLTTEQVQNDYAKIIALSKMRKPFVHMSNTLSINDNTTLHLPVSDAIHRPTLKPIN